MSQIVDPNAFYAGFLTATLHFPIQIAFCDREHPVVQTNVVLHLQILLHFICQKAWHSDYAIALFCFWRRDDVFPAGVLKCLVDRDCAFIKVKIRRGQRQQLPLTDAAPVQHLKSIKRQRLVHHCINELQILLLGPESHFTIFLLAHTPGFLAGIFLQVVVPDGVIENCADLILDAFEIHR